jgi:hypothetical protein
MKKSNPVLMIGIFLLIVPLVSLACSLSVNLQSTDTPVPPTAVPSATPLPAATTTVESAAACLLGTWDVGNLGPYLKDAIPPDQLQGATLEPKGYSGSLHYRFNPDGTAEVLANQYKLTSEVKLGILPLNLDININGTAKADYQVNEAQSTVSFSNPDTSGLTGSVTLAGNSVVDASQILPYVWFGASSNAVATLGFHCSGDTLDVTAGNGSQTPLFALKRVNP